VPAWWYGGGGVGRGASAVQLVSAGLRPRPAKGRYQVPTGVGHGWGRRASAWPSQSGCPGVGGWLLWLATVWCHSVVPPAAAARAAPPPQGLSLSGLRLYRRGWPLAAAMFVWLIDMERLTFEIRKVVVY
jgi:hypothetical protein